MTAQTKSMEVSREDLTKKGLTTTSSMIRFLLADGYSRGQVAKILNIRYQHVRNVEITPIKKQK